MLGGGLWVSTALMRKTGEDNEVLDPIERFTGENVGWMKIAADMFHVGWHGSVYGFRSGGWYVYYQRPPEVVIN